MDFHVFLTFIKKTQ